MSIKKLATAFVVVLALALPTGAYAAWQTITYVSGYIGTDGYVEQGSYTARTYNFHSGSITNKYWNTINYSSGGDIGFGGTIANQSYSRPANTSPTSKMGCGRNDPGGPASILMTCQTNDNFG